MFRCTCACMRLSERLSLCLSDALCLCLCLSLRVCVCVCLGMCVCVCVCDQYLYSGWPYQLFLFVYNSEAQLRRASIRTAVVDEAFCQGKTDT